LGGIYFTTGNGDAGPHSAKHSYGDAVVKVGDGLPDNPPLFLPNESGEAQLSGFNGQNPIGPLDVPTFLNQQDLDLSSGGPMLIPGTNTLIVGGKTGVMYVLDSSSMKLKFPMTTGFKFSFDQDDPDPKKERRYDFQNGPHLHGSPAYWQVSNDVG